jgi:hypothetical protein
MYKINYAHIDTLFQLSRISLFGYIILSVAIGALYQSFEEKSILGWTILAVGMGITRLILAFSYAKYTYSLTALTWYKLFTISNVVSALLYALLGFHYLPHLESTDLQYFIAISLIGLSGASIAPLSPDIRIAISYSSIILMPAMVSLWSIGSPETTVTGFFLFFYYISLVVLIAQIYKQNEELLTFKDYKTP